ncbi:steroid receptor RNA activator 1 [Achroia grisella]|uniref:steroid receptor RNA activator 1 n=1 Tax=Achroia grisella TaxID=688607 RepID=UPI0027D2B65A|nr:steroid receptor RNA activator 1 [Achroia grisella]
MDNINRTSSENGKVSFDPGWNDPPKFSYNAQQTTPNRPRNFLNKRVPFPLSSTGASPAPPPPVNLPPIPGGLSPAPVHITSKPELDQDINIDSGSALIEVKDILLTLLDTSSELENKANDIKRRICIMEEMWKSGKLNKSIHLHIRNLAYALKNDEPQKADEIHRALMVDHVSAVGSWMPGVKQLIHSSIARCELLAIDKD